MPSFAGKSSIMLEKALIILFSFLLSSAFSQSDEFKFNYNFESSYEESVFQRFLKNSTDSLHLMDYFFALDSSYTYSKGMMNKQKVDKFLKSIEKKVSKYGTKKKVKYIFENVHDEFFTKYDIEAFFSDIFDTSTYNCVTGSALYAYVFDYFKIPYQIKETPTHVFLVAYPRKENIYIETTVPGSIGSYIPSENMIKKAVDELVQLKLITPGEVLEKGYNKTFNDYYYGDENITAVELAGLQYFNNAISLANADKNDLAYESMLKSNMLYESDKSKLFTKGLLSQIVVEKDFGKIENFKWFITLCHSEEDHEYLKYKLRDIIGNDKLTDSERDIIEEKIMEEGFSKKLKNRLLEEVYVNRAARYDKMQQRKKAMTYAEKLYEINPQNLDAKNFIVTFSLNKLFQKNLGIDRIVDLENLVEKYPFVKEFGHYSRYRVFLYSYLVATNFNKNKIGKGENYLDILETILEEKSEEIDLFEEGIGKAYAAIGAYYYRRHSVLKSIEYLNKGLKYSPNNEDITRKLKLIKDSN